MDFRGASAESVTALVDELKTAVSGSDASAATVADSLFELSRTLRAEGALRRFATDASLPADAKKGLVTEVFDGLVDSVALGLLTSAVARKWTSSQDLTDALEHLSVIAVARSTGTEVDRIGDELFTLQQTVQDNAGLRDALSDPSRSVQDKAALVESLLAGKAMPATVTLAKQSLHGTYRTVSVALGEYQKVAASVEGEGVATVRVAKPLSSADEQRLSQALERKYGRPVHINVVVDPAVVGGIKVEIGDDVIDGTVSSRLDGARRALAG